jgi:hypothetical protein
MTHINRLEGTKVALLPMIFTLLLVVGCAPSVSSNSTPQEMVQIWAEHNESAKELSGAFPEEMLAVANEWVSRNNAGASKAELDKLASDGAKAIMLRNAHFVAQAPDVELLEFLRAQKVSFERVKARDPRLCVGFDRASDEDYAFAESLPNRSSTVTAMVAGRRAHMQRREPLPTDFAVYQDALAKQLKPAELVALQDPTLPRSAEMECNLKIGVFTALASMASEPRGRISASLLFQAK